jgi:ABC-type Mn2+/Zn2+ transport system permease subunit
MMAIAVAVSACSTVAGLLGSYWLSSAAHVSAPPGPLAVLLASAVYGASFGLRALIGRRPRAASAA